MLRVGIVSRHNVIRVISKCGFDCPTSFILDPFKRGILDKKEWKDDKVEEYTEEEFSKEFPHTDWTGPRDY